MSEIFSKYKIKSSSSATQDQSRKNVQTSSYTAALQRDVFPSRAQGLIMDAKAGLALRDYTVAVGNIVDPKNVIYASKISNGRICIYVKEKEIAENLTNKYKALEVSVNKESVALRPLVSKQQRIIISNVAPPIPHHILVDQFSSYGIKCSTITTLRAGIVEEGYEHVLSARRQTFIDKEDVNKLPDHFKITYEHITYYVYPSTDTLECYECQQEGHIRKDCPSLALEDENNDLNISSEKSFESIILQDRNLLNEKIQNHPK